MCVCVCVYIHTYIYLQYMVSLFGIQEVYCVYYNMKL